ncbi:MAG: hypothetical protein HZC54_14700 [Verrucomicrobia bacterium]|nr:hypothetical protein [Verrucomicrobiota bacterium]
MNFPFRQFTAIVASVSLCFAVSGAQQGDTLTLTSGACSVSFSAANGSILAITQRGKPGSICASGEHGLWHARFRDGGELCATNCAFTYERDAKANALHLFYRHDDLTVRVIATGRDGDVEFVAEVLPTKKTLLDFAVPARLRFDPDALDRFVCPSNGNNGVGMALRPAFFKQQSEDEPAGWRHITTGGRGYASLYGGSLRMRDVHDAPVALRVTAEGREWFGTGLAKRIASAQATVNRAPAKGQADLVLADSDNGAYFSASHLGGAGLLWRVGGFVGDKEQRLVVAMVKAAVEKLFAKAAEGRNKLGFVSLAAGPQRGGGTAMAVQDLLTALRASRTVVELRSPREMLAALGSREFLAIINPYGEMLPAASDDELPAAVAAIGKFVRAGGNWFEVGGYPFHAALRPVKWMSFSATYPPAFADFMQLDTRGGSASLYGVQPMKWPAWAGAKEPDAIFVPGKLGCGGDERGGWCERGFATFVDAGRSWRTPVVRLAIGKPVDKTLRDYCDANQIKQKLSEKMPADLLAKFKKSVLVYYAGNCAEKLAHLDKLPSPALVHFADYLKGGFDKEYPDHLPPQQKFGTPAQFREFFDRCHALGHLVMPYTNPTWWCDHPKGPTFEREGDAPLLRGLDGKPSYERYGNPGNDGWTICHWHPAVQRANRETVRQFSEDYPVDVLFQDQCGARGWCYDTNPASPTPFAYTDGLLSQVAEDAARKPLSTESGWDRAANYEAQLCGMTWGIVPTEGGPSWRRLMKHEYSPRTWDIFPLAHIIAHDKCSFVHHDLGQFVTNRETLAWTLALGYGLSYRIAAPALDRDGPREWLRWLDRLQKSVVARYIGEPLKAFTHERWSASSGRDSAASPRRSRPEAVLHQTAERDNGIIRASYGPVEIIANLDAQPCLVAGRALPAFGFRTTAPGVVATSLQDDGTSFVTEGCARHADVWVYATPEGEVAVELPARMTGRLMLTLDGASATPTQASGRVVRLRLPARDNNRDVKFLWHATVAPQ